jgi:aminopeptidase
MLNKKRIDHNIEVLITKCAGVRPNAKVLVISDNETKAIGEFFKRKTLNISNKVKHITVAQKNLRFHGDEPPVVVARHMFESDFIFCLTRSSLAHTHSRKKATDKGACFLSLPDYSWKLLARKSFDFDFGRVAPLADKLARLLTKAGKVQVKTRRGTDICFSISGRKANSHPGCCRAKGALASPPDSEVNIAPLETSAEGTIVVDGSIPYQGFGRMSKPAVITMKSGKITAIKGYKSKLLKHILFGPYPRRNVLAEFGIGLNSLASLCGIMLEDEGAVGTCHFGFGSNTTIGGKNEAGFHMDMVIKATEIKIDRKKILVRDFTLIPS